MHAVCTTPALTEQLEDRVLLSIDVLVSDLNPATTNVANTQSSSDIDISPNGTIVVAWENVNDSGETNVMFRRYTSSGIPLDATDRPVSLVATGNEAVSSVATAPDGSFAIAYISAWANRDAYFDIYDANGNFTRRVSVYGSESQYQIELDLAITPDGNIVAVWTEEHFHLRTGLHQKIYARVYDGQGNPLTHAFVVGPASSDFQNPFAPRYQTRSPSVAVDLAGNFVVAYSTTMISSGGGTSHSLEVQRFAADGTPQGTPQVLSPASSNPGDAFYGPHVGRAYDGSFVVGYTSAGNTYSYWHLFNSDGSQRSEGILASSSLHSIDMDAWGNFVMVAGGSTTFFDSTGRRGETIAISGNVAIANNLLAISGSTAGDVEFSVIEQRHGKFGVARPNSGGGLTFYLDSNANRHFDAFDDLFDFGLAGDIVVVGDWNRDGADEVGVGRPNGTGGLTFYLDSNGNRVFDNDDLVFNFGLPGDIVVVGDWDGDGSDDLGVARPNGTGGLTFFLDSNGSRYFEPTDSIFNFGLVGDHVVAGDWDGDGIDQIGVGRPNRTGGLIFSLDSNGSRFFEAGQDAVFNFGLERDGIVAGDWDGDGTDALAAARPNETGGQRIFSDQNENYQSDLTDSLFTFDFGLPDDLLFAGSWRQTALRSA